MLSIDCIKLFDTIDSQRGPRIAGIDETVPGVGWPLRTRKVEVLGACTVMRVHCTRIVKVRFHGSDVICKKTGEYCREIVKEKGSTTTESAQVSSWRQSIRSDLERKNSRKGIVVFRQTNLTIWLKIGSAYQEQ